MNLPLIPNAKELKALTLFVSADMTRVNMTTLHVYQNETGSAYLATDGHTLCLRRAGSAIDMPYHEVSKMPCTTSPPAWPTIMNAPAENTGAFATLRSVNPAYVARVGAVETAAGARAAEDFEPGGLRGKTLVRVKQNAKVVLATLELGGDALAPWRFKLRTPQALWEVLVMPRTP